MFVDEQLGSNEDSRRNNIEGDLVGCRILDEVFVFLCDQGGCLLLGTGSEKLRLEIALYFWVQIESLSFATAALLFSLVLFTLPTNFLFNCVCSRSKVPEDERWGVLFSTTHIHTNTTGDKVAYCMEH